MLYDDIDKLFKYLYPSGYELGLKRKFEKCKDIVDNPPKYSMNMDKIDKDDLICKLSSGLSILDISKIYLCSYRKIYNYCKNNNIK